MTEIHDRLIEDPAAWTNATVGGKAGLTVDLDGPLLDIIDRALERTRGLATHQIKRRHFSHLELDRFMAGVKAQIMDGRGVVLIRGVSPARYSETDFERIFWGLGSHLGDAAVQSRRGDRLGYVKQEEDDATARGYRSNLELSLHADVYELAALMCVRTAASGGYSRVVSSLSLHNAILKTRPEMLPALYRGFNYAISEAKFSTSPITAQPVPIFCNVQGKVSCAIVAPYMREAARQMGVPLPDDLVQALKHIERLDAELRDEIGMQFLLDPGEMLFWHNFTTLHSRTAFQNSETQKRLLLRLWLEVPNGRPVDPAFLIRAAAYKQVYQDYLAETA